MWRHFVFSDFECILDRHLQPLPFTEPTTLQISDRGKVHWATSSLENIRDELPPGAQRYAWYIAKMDNYYTLK